MSQLGLYQRDEYIDYMMRRSDKGEKSQAEKSKNVFEKEWPKLTKFEEIHGYTSKRKLNKPQRRGTQRESL